MHKGENSAQPRLRPTRLAPVLAALIVLLLGATVFGCSRSRIQKQAVADAQRDSSLASSQVQVSRVLAASPEPPRSPAELVRPSPFAEPPPPAPAAKRIPAASAQLAERAEAAQKLIKPFVAPATRITAPKTEGILPPPPLFPQTSPGTAPDSILGRRPCCFATASYERPKPKRLQRIIGKVPGLRRLHRDADSEEGFLPPRPLHPNTFNLPPSASPLIMETRHMDLKATINESGAVTQVELLAPKDADLVALAAYAATDWHFTPARLNDKPVASEVVMHFNFDRN